MSTIIRALRWSGAAALVLALWALVMLAMPFLGPSGRQVAVVGESGRAVRTILRAGGRVVEVRRGAVLASSADPDFPSRLYRSGAGLVLEGRIAAGCFRR
jgi:hypothetical protein